MQVPLLREKLSWGVCDKVRAQNTCLTAETSWSIVILSEASLAVILTYLKVNYKVPDQTAGLLFAYNNIRFFHDKAQLTMNNYTDQTVKMHNLILFCCLICH